MSSSPRKHRNSSDSLAIFDNRCQKVADYLRKNIGPESNLSIVSAYFTIYGYGAIKDNLDQSKHTRFLFGEPSAVKSLDPNMDEGMAFLLNEEGGMELKNSLSQKSLAQECNNWIQDKVDVKTIKDSSLLHGKLYHIANSERTAALMGSSNMTHNGLGCGVKPNVELNMDIRNEHDRADLLEWFNNLWNDESLTRDAKKDVLAALQQLCEHYSPEFVYYKTLYHVLHDRLNREISSDELIRGVKLKETKIWSKLYEFQKHGATSAINRLLRHNGCIIADSVGLGKTWTALAVIKYFESLNDKVLVLCPNRLKDNWLQYTSYTNVRHNKFNADRFQYTVLAHTDLSRIKGKSGIIDLANFNWSNFQLIVIDESHNFRNEGHDKRDKDGNFIKYSRYNRLLNEVLKEGVPTKVLMLSATPVNTSLIDLRNQVYLMSEKREDAFKDQLGINNLKEVFTKAQKEFQTWEKNRSESQQVGKDELLEKLGPDFLSLLDAVTLARSRRHIVKYYPDVTKKIGGFPSRSDPDNKFPETDNREELSYEDINRRIGALRLALYMPSQYLIANLGSRLNKLGFNEDHDRFKSPFTSMLRVNLLKRLESSVHSLSLTLKRMSDKLSDMEDDIESWKASKTAIMIEEQVEIDDDDDDLISNDVNQYRFDEIDVELWQQHLKEDKKAIDELYQEVKKVNADRDQKLACLKSELRCKIKNPNRDKDGKENRKALIFTTFSDTAQYLYENLSSWVQEEFNLNIALVTGGRGNKSSIGKSNINEILSLFAPRAQQNQPNCDNEIDIIVATDCLSEGQNLQDCDLVINYDIHWNPIRLMQRFGRIDRLGSRNNSIRMINFWPTKDLDLYLNLQNRVEARMALADATATGFDDPLSKQKKTEAVRQELIFRDRQLKQIQNEVLDIENLDDSVGLNDLTLDDFVADLLSFIELNKVKLENTPMGIYSIFDLNKFEKSTGRNPSLQPGVIFCLKRNSKSSKRTPNRLWPYFLVYVQENGEVKLTFLQSQRCLSLLRDIVNRQPDVIDDLEVAFALKTKNGRKMEKYEEMLYAALDSIQNEFRSAEIQELFKNPNAILTDKINDSLSSNEFTLVTWFILNGNN